MKGQTHDHLNAVAKRIHSRGLADILNSKLPPAGAVPVDDDPELANEPDDVTLDDAPAIETPPAVVNILNSPAPRPRGKRTDEGRMYRRILDYISAHPLSTKDDLVNAIGLMPTTIDYHLKRMQALGDVVIDHQRKGRAHRYRVADAPAVAAAAD